MVNPVASPSTVHVHSEVQASPSRQPSPTSNPEISSTAKAQPVAADTVRISTAGNALQEREGKRK
jgi:hypothetical protein